MADPKVIVPYATSPHDLSTVYLAVCTRTPRVADWRPAYRDVVDGQPVVWVRSPHAGLAGMRVWLHDSAGVRRVTPMSRSRRTG